jgi:hypothetical protein
MAQIVIDEEKKEALFEGVVLKITSKYGKFKTSTLSGSEGRDEVRYIRNNYHIDSFYTVHTYDGESLVRFKDIKAVEVVTISTIGGKKASPFEVEFYKEHGRRPTKEEKMDGLRDCVEEEVKGLFGAMLGWCKTKDIGDECCQTPREPDD